MPAARIAAAACGLLMQSAFAADEGVALLDRMSKAMQSLDYSGTFIYRHKDKVETLKIIHRNSDGHIDERLITMSGKPREIIRSGSTVTCIWPESRLVLIDKSRPRSNFPGVLFEDLDRLDRHYEVSVQEQTERIAGRECLIVDVRPKDGLRYGYRLWIDRESHLLVRSDLLDQQQKPIEQVVFTELSLHDTLPDEAFQSALMDKGFRRKEIGEAERNSRDAPASSSWYAGSLPPGFVLQAHKQRSKNGANPKIEHMVFSDGLSSVSVFIEPAGRGKLLQGYRRRGGLNVYGKMLDNYHITVVGEVPQKTVELIAESIHYKKTIKGGQNQHD